MTDQIAKAYYMNALELSVLLAAKGVRELYGFPMPDGAGIGQEEIYRVLFQLNQKGLVSVTDGKVCVKKDVNAVLEDIVGAETVWVFIGREEYPEQCIYMGNKAVFVELYGQDGRLFRFEPADRREVPDRMMASGFMVPKIVETPCLEKVDEDEGLAGLARSLFDRTKKEIGKVEEISCCLLEYSLRTRDKIRQVFILERPVETYLVVSDEKEDLVFYYSEGKTKALLEQMIGGMV